MFEGFQLSVLFLVDPMPHSDRQRSVQINRP